MLIKNPLFHLGNVVATPAALNALQSCNVSPAQLLQLHVSGNWGVWKKMTPKLTTQLSTMVTVSYRVTALVNIPAYGLSLNMIEALQLFFCPRSIDSARTRNRPS